MSLMMQEIFEQPEALRRTYEAEGEHAFTLREIFRERNSRMVVLVVRGTSDNAARFGRCPPVVRYGP